MNRLILCFAFSSLAIGNFQLVGQEKQEQKSQVELKSFTEKASYLLGHDIGGDVLRRELEIDPELFVRGILDALEKKSPPLSKTEVESVMKLFEKKENDKANAKWTALAKSNLEKGVAFLGKNKLVDGVIQLESGLQYKTLAKGSGEKPKNGQKVVVHVKGQHLDGEVFEDTYENKKPVTVTVGATLRGLDEALRRMNVGSKWQLFIPAELGFGQRGSPPIVGPNETLIYEVEIVELAK